MALRAGRVGVSPDIVDNNGFIKNMGGGEPVDTYTKEEIDQKLSGKANTSDVYTQSQVDTLLNGKADKSDTYTKDATNNILLDLLPDLFDTPPNVEASGNPLVLTDSAGGNAAECIVTLEPIQSGSGTPSPQNVRPISGRTQSVIYRYGKNLFNASDITRRYASDPQTRLETGSIVKVNIGDKIVFSTDYAGIQFGVIFFDDANKTTNIGDSGWLNPNTAYTIQHDGFICLGSIGIRYENNAAFSDADIANLKNAHTQLEIGSTATTYEPYNGESITRTYRTTIYGGTDDVTGDGATATYDIADLGNLVWEYYGPYVDQNLFYTDSLVGSIAHRTDADSYGVCSIYEQYPNSAIGTMGNYGMRVRTSDGRIYVNDSRYTDANSFKTAVTGQKFAYELATPTSIPLTAQNITLLHGDNVLTTDGTSIALSYPVNVASYIRRKLGMSTESTRAVNKSLASEEIQEEVKEVSDLTPLEEVVEINTVEPVATVTTTKTTKRTSTKKSTRRK